MTPAERSTNRLAVYSLTTALLTILSFCIGFPQIQNRKSLANPACIVYAYRWERISPGGLRGLQNRCWGALRSWVGSTPMRSRWLVIG